MRFILGGCSLMVLLTGCGSPSMPDTPQITLELPADKTVEQNQPTADAACKPLGKTAKFRAIEKHGENTVAVFDCQ